MVQPPERPEGPHRTEWAEDRSRRGERTRGDLAILLMELARATKGLRYYGGSHPNRRDLLDRCYLAWQADLQRAGPIDLLVDDRAFHCAGVFEGVPHGHFADLAAVLRERGGSRVRLRDDLSRDAFHAFVELLALNDDALRNRGGFAQALADRAGGGIALGEPEDDGEVTAELPADEIPAAEPEPDAIETPEMAPARDELPPPLPPHTPSPEPQPEAPPKPATPPAGSSLGSALLRSSAEEVEAFESRTLATLEENPLDVPGCDEREEAVRLTLRDLQHCRDDERYAHLAEGIAGEAAALAEAGLEPAAYRAILVLADHAVGLDGRPAAQVQAAQNALDSLAMGPRLDAVIDRVCELDATVAIRAAQVLLQLGGRVVESLLDRLEKESDPDRAAQLRAAVLSLGERGVPVLVAAIKQGSRERARLAIRIAGELQSRHMVPTLAGVIRTSPADLSREAARALAHIGGPAAVAALEESLASLDPGVREVAASSLGAIGGPEAVRALLGVLDDNGFGGQRSPALARVAIRELATLGSDAAVPKLVSILERRSMFRRRDQRELKLAALGALARLHAGEARRAILRAVRSRDPEVRRRAQQIAEQLQRADSADAGAGAHATKG